MTASGLSRKARCGAEPLGSPRMPECFVPADRILAMAVAAAAVFLLHSVSFPRGRALGVRPLVQFMRLGRPRARRESVHIRIRMNILASVHPGSSPTGVVDEESVPAPIEAVEAPAPRPEESRRCVMPNPKRIAPPTKKPGRGAKKTTAGS